MGWLLERAVPVSLLLIATAAVLAAVASLLGAPFPGLRAAGQPGWERVSAPGHFDTSCAYMFQADLWPEDDTGMTTYFPGIVARAFVYEEIGDAQFAYVSSTEPAEMRFGTWDQVNAWGGTKAVARAPATLWRRCPA